MRNVFSLLAAALLLTACGRQTQEDGPLTVDFKHSGCGRTEAVKADGPGNEQPELTLEYKDGSLLMTRTNALLNCSINQGGITCDVTLVDGVIHYKAFETDGATLKCLCPVKTMTTLVGGLRENTEYVLDYTCDSSYRPITFYYAKGLKITLDLNLYKQ